MERLINLEFEYSKFEEIIDKETMEIHHSKHLNAYVTNYNNAIKDTSIENVPVREVLKNIDTVDESIKQAVINNGGGIVNHELYFTQFKKGTKITDENFTNDINETFGSFENMIEEIKSTGLKRFGSGWTWLVIKNNKLEVISTLNQDSPLMEGYTPLLGIDVWEHAYYLKYQNRRPEYLENILNIIDWEKIQKIYNS